MGKDIGDSSINQPTPTERMKKGRKDGVSTYSLVIIPPEIYREKG
jgi:hypothetical protein